MFFWNGPFGFFSVFYFFQELIYLKESHFTSLFMLIRFVWFVFIVDEAKYFYIHRNKRLLSLLKFFLFNFTSKFVAGMLRNGNECSCLRFFLIKKERNFVYREIFSLFIYLPILCCHWANLRLGDFKTSIK